MRTLAGQLVRARPGGGAPARSARRDLRWLYHKHFGDSRKERQLCSTAAFYLTAIAVRVVTHAIRAGKSPFGNLRHGGKRVHHMAFGIVGLLATGYLWLLEIGTGVAKRRRASCITSATYGASAALTLDEFALWLDLEDVYWAKAGRKSIHAVVLFGSLLALGRPLKGILLDLTRTIRADPRTRPRRRRLRFLHRSHPKGLRRTIATHVRQISYGRRSRR